MDFRKVAVWTATIFVAAVFLFAGADKIVHAQAWQQRFVGEWGLPAWLAVVTGLLEIAGAALLVVPRRATYGGAIVAAVMIGAVGTHVVAGQLAQIVTPLILGSLAAAVAWYRCPWCRGEA